MVKKLKYIIFLIPLLFVVNVNAEVLDGTATLGSGVLWTGSSYVYTPNVSLSYGDSNTYVFSSSYDNPFIMGARYITSLNLGSTGANTFSGVVEIPVAITSPNDVSLYNRPTSNAFHISLGSFYDWSSLTYEVTAFSSTCSSYSPVQFSFPYEICVYRVSFNARSSSMIYGGTNLSWGVYDTSNANNLVFQPLGHAWGSAGNGSWAFPKKSTDIDGGENIAPYYILSYGNNISETLLQQQIQQQQTIINQNQTIINQQNSNTNSIINNQDSNTQDIIDNQDANTEAQIESQKVCSDVDVWTTANQSINSFIGTNGVINTSSVSNTTDYIKVVPNNIYKLTYDYNETFNPDRIIAQYDINKVLISSQSYFARDNNVNINVGENTYYLRITYGKTFSNIKLSSYICRNGNQALSDNINDLNDSITDISSPDTDSSLSDMSDSVASYTPISDLIAMPLTLFRAYINGINSTCSPVNLGNLYGTNLVLPCINLEQRLGSNLWSGIDTICCIFLIYEIAMLFVSAFDGITSLRDDFEGLYQPRHADTGYVPKHGGGN